ncbi:MAG: putative penicillin-binding protein [Parcubacteria group bacterium]|nr:putative penicillin-binding protein [Parcubacteria group bacterium]
MKERRKDNRKRNRVLIGFSGLLFLLGMIFLWVASLRIPDLSDLADRKVIQSTKIYDRTGQILLYDMSSDVRRTVVPFESISPNIKKATLAIEDKDFYSHGGVKVSSFLRALLVNITTLSYSQGGSTITQQVVKNVILNGDKTPTRKIKEWILAEKLDKALPKDEILNLYLNESPYGGAIYGVEEASLSYFGKESKNVTVSEAAYLAAMTKAPTYYSPYGLHKDKLEERKNLVLREMLQNNFITQAEFDAAMLEKITFSPKANNGGLRAPHFVFFVMDYLAKKYGEETFSQGGMKIITTLDYDIQAKAEAIAKKYGATNQKNFNADNNAFVVIDPKTGGILAMTGSRDYFDDTINGNFNVATAHRQPGSTFKPFVYAGMFNKGYTPDTILFDVPTQFSVNCAQDNFTSDNGCYSPGNFDSKFRGPMRIREALALSINVPAVKGLYLNGIQDSLDLAKAMGIEDLGDPAQYGLTLVLGGGEVSPLDLTSAYSVFANDGVRNPYNPIMKIQDGSGRVIEEFTPAPVQVLPSDSARKISDILSDNNARSAEYGLSSPLNIPDRQVAVKTGTTNNSKDAWIMGYTPNLVIGAWVGNNDNTPMVKKIAGFIVAPMWRELMDATLSSFPVENFPPAAPTDQTIKPVLRGVWQGGTTQIYDPTTNTISSVPSGEAHSILYYVNKNDPLGPAPSNPSADPQFKNWEYGVQHWMSTSGYSAPQPQAVPIINPLITPGGAVPVIIPQEGQTLQGAAQNAGGTQ